MNLSQIPPKYQLSITGSMTMAHLLCILTFWAPWASAQEYEFIKVTTQQGLSHSTVYDIEQDNRGLIWLGTREGLNRYDSHQIKTYYAGPPGTNGLASNQINSLLSVGENLLVGTEKGLNEYLSQKETFITHIGGGLDDQSINKLYRSENGNIYICTSQGLFVMDDTKKPKQIMTNVNALSICNYKTNIFWLALNKKILLINNFGEIIKTYDLPTKSIGFDEDEKQFILTIFKDSEDRVWLSTSKGVLFYNVQKDTFEKASGIDGLSELENNLIRDIAEDKDCNLWFGGESGVYRYNKKEEGVVHYGQSFHSSPNHLSDQAVYSLFVSRDNIVWAGTYFGGANYLKSLKNGFSKILPNDFKKSISGKAVSDIIQDKKGRLWIGTEDGGVTIYNRSQEKFSYLKNDPKNLNSLSSNNVHSIFEDNDGSIWIGTFFGGLNRYDPQKETFTLFKNIPEDSLSLSNDYVYAVTRDSQGRLWVGTQHGLNLFNDAQNNFSAYKEDILGNRFIYDILEDSAGDLWFCTRNSGIFRLHAASEKLTHYTTSNASQNGLPSDKIISIYEDKSKKLWFGSLNGGAIWFDRKKDKFEVVNKKDGLPNNNVYGIIEDPTRGYWVSTNKGLTLFKPGQSLFKTYTVSDGLSANQFNFKSSFKDTDGWIYFGSVNGLTYFHPDSLILDHKLSKIYFRNLKLFSKNVPISEKSPLTLSLDYMDTLVLKHHQNALIFEYVGIDYLSKGRNSYAYYLEGFENEWNFVGDRQSATYTNLQDGDYVFHLKSNVSNVTDLSVLPERSLVVKILPPFWKTGWAYALYVFLAVLVVYVYFRFARFINNKNMAVQLEKVEREKVNEIAMNRLNFFTFISHEFKTPLTLIIAAVEQFSQKYDMSPGNIPKELVSVKRSAGRLYHLVQQLMLFRKIETDHESMKLVKGDVVLFIKDTFEAFEPLCENKSINAVFETNLPGFFCHFDADKFEMILTNLIANAIKNMDSDGSLSLSITIQPPSTEEDNAAIEFTLQDSGHGFTESERENIFTPFYTNSRKGPEKSGAGIGLSLVKSLVNFLSGDLKIKSVPNEGTTCSVSLPLFMENHKGKMTEVEHIHGNKNTTLPDDLIMEFEKAMEEEDKIPPNQDQSLLLVEDNKELLNFLTRHYSTRYKVFSARNGKEALLKIDKIKPDLIISDIKMPLMDGVQLCQKLKGDPTNGHIPFILLTAKTTEQAKMEALSAGANAYMHKPFNLKELDFLVRNQLAANKNLKSRFSDLVESNSNSIPVNNKEREFLLKIINLIEDNFDDPDFSIEKLAQKAGISRSLLHIKMKKITETNASGYIKRRRIDKAVVLLQKGYPISEVAYKVGYNDPNYFSRVFKQQMEVSPSEYVKNERGENY
ncbi:hybrid sensor histidine kinase/response regulator transcription factor [Sinomicrobium sp. M5D2P17]